MAASEAPLNVVFTAVARMDMIAVWDWNAVKYGVRRADRYLAFIETEITHLSQSPETGTVVDGYPRLRKHLAKRKTRGHGHIIFYETLGDQLVIITILHSAQDWSSRIGSL